MANPWQQTSAVLACLNGREVRSKMVIQWCCGEPRGSPAIVPRFLHKMAAFWAMQSQGDRQVPPAEFDLVTHECGHMLPLTFVVLTTSSTVLSHHVLHNPAVPVPALDDIFELLVCTHIAVAHTFSPSAPPTLGTLENAGA